MSDDRPASDKQVRYALDLLRARGISPDETVTAWVRQRHKQLPVGDTVREAVKSLSMTECNNLIKECLGQ